MSLVSGLLKHLIIAETVGIPFTDTVVSRDSTHGKPCYIRIPTPASQERVEVKSVAFNVSHQAGLVALIAIPTVREEEYDVGVDIVCVNERNDDEKILAAPDPRLAWNDFVVMHGEVFSPSELPTLQITPEAQIEVRRVGGREGLEKEIWERMRRFYALWCVREAYVKMTGEALLAEWLRELEFKEWPVPAPEKKGDGIWGEMLGDGEGAFEILQPEEGDGDVQMRIVALGSRYMIASAVRRRDGRKVDVEYTWIKEVGVQEIVRRVRAAV